MTKIPKTPEEIFQEFTADFKRIYNGDLVSIILYGSGARGEYVPKKSDLNFLIVLSDQGLKELKKSLNLIPRWRKRNVSLPLFLSKSYIESSLDSFPMEFLEMKQHHQVVYGEDVLKDLEIKREDLRLQCEREIKGKLLYLREGYLSSGGKKKALQMLISQSLPAFVAIFSALLRLKDIEVPGTRIEVLNKTAEVFDFDQQLFRNLLEVRQRKVKFSRQELTDLVERYIGEVEKLTTIIDSL
ncbi:MAG: nucleotidyltransferase domain-containing protein [candidate division KSB1 bacterium]|nr:nucleotidyltransferase domain-containing protein [candidate division KSB1 bacterium]